MRRPSIASDTPAEGDTPLKLPVIRDSTPIPFSAGMLITIGTGLVGFTVWLTALYFDVRDLKAAVAEIRSDVKTLLPFPTKAPIAKGTP